MRPMVDREGTALELAIPVPRLFAMLDQPGSVMFNIVTAGRRSVEGRGALRMPMFRF